LIGPDAAESGCCYFLGVIGVERATCSSIAGSALSFSQDRHRDLGRQLVAVMGKIRGVFGGLHLPEKCSNFHPPEGSGDVRLVGSFDLELRLAFAFLQSDWN
jgi:hypothetical protein